MKNKVLYIAVILLVVIYTSCSKIAENLQRDAIVTDTVYFEIPVISTLDNALTLPNVATTINLENQINAQVQDLRASNLHSVKLKSIHLGLAEIVKDSIDTKNNFANLQSIKFSLTDGSKTDSLASVSIPSKTLSRGLSLNPVILPETLKPYISKPAMKYSITIKAKEVTTAVMTVGAAMSYTVTLVK